MLLLTTSRTYLLFCCCIVECDFTLFLRYLVSYCAQFTMGIDGSKVNARYSFLYIYEDGEWKIAHHHSSAMPEGLLAAAEKVKQMEFA